MAHGHRAGEVTEQSTSGSTGSRKGREKDAGLGLGFLKPQSPPPGTQFLQ